MERFLCVHGHFYQPPRENPWTEEVPREPSAAPFHDWNERIDAECYRANAHARVVDGAGRVVSIVNNFAHLSFNVGPTLLDWLRRHDPDTYQRILEGDREGGGAMAQAYFHAILPLCNDRDVRTNVRWGLADFRHRFGRRAEGMWLPETAADERVLRVLAEEGVRFTILAPTQAAEPVDVRRAYRCEGVSIVFFDGPLSHAAAFEGLSSQALVERAELAAPEGGLVTVATDGETFGHHHPYADRALAYALTVEAPRRGVRVITPAAFLAAEPPAETVRIARSSWSCAHGVARWAEDCGCSTGGQPGWNQQWRAPLRAALDLLRDAGAAVFERRGATVFRDPWEARDAYVDVLLDPGARDAFLLEHTKAGADATEALTLLESQRCALAMYTSCGWFFNDLAGIETIYVLRFAARMMDLLRELGEDPPEAAFLDVLATARSNEPDEGDGRRVWERHVLPARVDAARVVAHLALVDLLERPLPEGRLAGFDVDWLEHGHQQRGRLSLCTGRVALTHGRTLRRTEHVYAALRLGGLEVLGARREGRDGDDADLDAIGAAFAAGEPVTAILRLIAERVGTDEFDLSSALPGAADHIVASVAQDLTERFAAAYDRLFEDHRDTLDALARTGFAFPPELRAPTVLSLSRRFEAEVAAQGGSADPGAYENARRIVDLAHRHGVRLATPQSRKVMEGAIRTATARAVAPGASDADTEPALQLLQLAHELDLWPDVVEAQELVYAALLERPTPSLRLLGTALGLAVETLGDPA